MSISWNRAVQGQPGATRWWGAHLPTLFAARAPSSRPSTLAVRPCPFLIIRPLPPLCTDDAQISCSYPASTPSSRLALAMLQASQTQNIQQLNGTTHPELLHLGTGHHRLPSTQGLRQTTTITLVSSPSLKTLQQICPLLSLLTVTIQGSGCQNLSPRQLWEPPHWSPGF